jgi:hypothetical protein
VIERYERVPAQYRRERDGDGVSVDERLVASLDAAHGAIDDLSRQLSQNDVAGFPDAGAFHRDSLPRRRAGGAERTWPVTSTTSAVAPRSWSGATSAPAPPATARATGPGGARSVLRRLRMRR